MVDAFINLLKSAIPHRVARAAWALGRLKAVRSLPAMRVAARRAAMRTPEDSIDLNLAIAGLESLAALPATVDLSAAIEVRQLPRVAARPSPDIGTLPAWREGA